MLAAKSGVILHDLTPDALVRGLEANHEVAFASVGRYPGADLVDDGTLLRYITGVPHPLFNGVVRRHFDGGALDTQIAATLAPFVARAVPLLWWVFPSTQPADLGAHLLTHGLVDVGATPGLALDLATLATEPPRPAGFAVEEVLSLGQLRLWADVLAAGGDFPPAVGDALYDLFATLGLGTDRPWRHFLGRVDDTPIAVGSLLLAGGVAGIWNMATLPEARRRGFGGALVTEALCQARTAGYRVGTLTASPLGLPVYHRLGFVEHCTVGWYLRPASEAQAP